MNKLMNLEIKFEKYKFENIRNQNLLYLFNQQSVISFKY